MVLYQEARPKVHAENLFSHLNYLAIQFIIRVSRPALSITFKMIELNTPFDRPPPRSDRAVDNAEADTCAMYAYGSTFRAAYREIRVLS